MIKPLAKVLLTFIIFSQYAFAQDAVTEPEKYTAHNKGKFYIYYGGNRESYSKSDINFSGDGYNFTLHDVKAQDKPKGWTIDYVNPTRMTIPQTNFRVGYFISDHYNISIGFDHMKYVMTTDQFANMNGYIDLPQDQSGAVFNGIYNNVPKQLTKDFLEYEHTDGLNYVNLEIARVDDLLKLCKVANNSDIFQLNITEGVGGGVLYPRTNTTLMGKQRHDEFHISGFGVSAKAGINLTFFKHYFIQGELKGGYINMPDVRTTYAGIDRASQHFMFLERIITFGGIFKI
ncbi:hypothetical protein FMM05_14310 [Flavobacterium zepuense]|uniref:Outermembrane protein n=1 Tax=Flavobacterium zepuense TaxID=2593302 RepID=A0A552UYP1_9FLAO|nr:hypothetical protein [Flavobacterium zepuense]TRW23363.1 hypothetical protein FMM05_14310 [Flavobacterium zepuense]